jgi:hypothetical protein
MLNPYFLLCFNNLVMVVDVAEPVDRGLLLIVLKGLQDLWLAGFLGQIDSIDVLKDTQVQVKCEILRNPFD